MEKMNEVNMKIEDKIDNILRTTTVVDEYKTFEDELLNVRRMMRVTDRNILERCSKIIGDIKKKRIKVPDELREIFDSACALFAESDDKEYVDSDYDEHGNLKKGKRKKKQRPDVEDDIQNYIDTPSSG